jgi:DNA-binding CsgD family transcriptional regulator
MAQLSQADVDQIIKLNRLTREVSSVDQLRNETLRQMEDMFNATSSMFLLRPEGSLIATFDRYIMHGLPESFAKIYAPRGLLHDPFAHSLLSQPGIELRREVQIGNEIVPYEKLIDMPFYWQYMHRYDIYHMLRIELVINQRSIATVGFFRPESEPNFSQEDTVKATLASTAIANALARELHKERSQENISILEKTSTALSQIGFLILDEHLNVIYCDANAKERCRDILPGDNLSLDNFLLPHNLMGPIFSFHQRLNNNENNAEIEEAFTLRNSCNKRTTNVHVRAHKTIYGRWRVLVFLEPDQQQHCSTTRLIDFGLTGREAETVQLVVAGLKNSEIAAKLSISINTVQCHLHTIFKKLNIRSRPELILKVTTPLSTAISQWIQ